jgi:hypothetical protein
MTTVIFDELENLHVVNENDDGDHIACAHCDPDTALCGQDVSESSWNETPYKLGDSICGKCFHVWNTQSACCSDECVLCNAIQDQLEGRS